MTDNNFTPFTMAECEGWLDDVGLPFEFHASVYDGLIAQAAKALLAALPLEIILDTAYGGERSLLSEKWHSEDAEKVKEIAEQIKARMEDEPESLRFVVERICSEIVLDVPTMKAAQWLQDVAADSGDERISGIALRRRAIKELEEEMYDITKGNLWLVRMAFAMEAREDPSLYGTWHGWKANCDYKQAIQDGMDALREWQESLKDKMPSETPRDEEDGEDFGDPLAATSQTTTSAPTPEQDTDYFASITDTQIASMQS